MADKETVAKTTNAAAAQKQADSVAKVSKEEPVRTSEEAPKAPESGVDVQVNPALDTEKVSIATGETDDEGNLVYKHFLSGQVYTEEEALLAAKDFDGTHFLVKTQDEE